MWIVATAAGHAVDRAAGMKRAIFATTVAALLCCTLTLVLIAGESPHPFRAAAPAARAGLVEGAPGRQAKAGAALERAESDVARLSNRLGRRDSAFWPRAEHATLAARAGGMRAEYTRAGLKLASTEGTLSLAFAGLRGAPSIGPVNPRSHGNEVLYRHAGVSEFYRNGPGGIDQGFTIARDPRAGKPLAIALRAGGSVAPRVRGSGLLFRSPDATSGIRYGGLVAVDASGRRLSTRITVKDRLITLHVAAGAARYPVTVDPFIEDVKLKKITAKGLIGWSVALSGNGRVALVSAPIADQNAGAVSVFTRSAGGWKQTASLTASGEEGTGEFGYSLSLSADGDTALIGAPYEEERMGGAWVFTRTGSTWTQSARIAPADARARGALFGWSVSLSPDGHVAAIGAPGELEAKGAAWVFTGGGPSWTQSGAKLIDAEEAPNALGKFGYSVAVAGDTVLVGEPYENVLWSFTRSGSQWGDATKILQPGRGKQELSLFGWSVSLSANGRVALAGGPHYQLSAGGSWAFERTGSGWKQMGKVLVGTHKSFRFEGGNEDVVLGDAGASVSLSADGKRAIVGGPGYKINLGAIWVFEWTGSAWKSGGTTLAKHEAPEGGFGSAVAMAGDGSVALAGGPNNSGHEGGVWTFLNAKSTAKHRQASKRKGAANAGGGHKHSRTGRRQ